MARQILFIQGGGAGAHGQWDDKLVASLGQHLGPGYDIAYPQMPHEDDPSYSRWSAAIREAFESLDDGAILVAHSVGATILVNAIAEQPPSFTPAAILLIAPPFIGKGGWQSDEFRPREHLGADLPDGVPIHIYHGDADDTVPTAHITLYAKAIPQAVIRALPGRDHQLGNDLSEVAGDIKALHL